MFPLKPNLKRHAVLLTGLALINAPVSSFLSAQDAPPPPPIIVEDILIELPPETPEAAPIEVEAVTETPQVTIELEGSTLPSNLPVIPVITAPVPVKEETILQLPQGGVAAPTFSEEETITVNYLDQDITSILRNVADLYDLNLVVPDTLTGRTSLKLRNVTWRQVYQVVLESSGFTYIEDNNIIKIKSLEELAIEPVDTRVFIINFASASEIQSAIQPLVSSAAGGGIRVDNRTNALIITERPSRMTKIQEIIERLDRETEQVVIESKFVEVSNRDVENIGVNWASLNGFQVGTGPATREFNRNNSRDSVSGRDSSGSSSSGSQSGSTDSASSGFSSRSNNTSGGTGFSDTIENAGSSALNSSTSTTSSAALSNFTNLLNNSSIGRTDRVVFSADGFSLILSALSSMSDVRLVSNPTVVTLNNKPAIISIGERFPVPNFTYNEQRGAFEVSNFTFEDIGIKLNVTPQVNSAGFINLDILPEVSSRSGTVSFGGASGAEIPIIASRRTETTITIKDGFTLAIGGLMENQTEKGETRVPLLGDIPLLGRMFRSDTSSVTARNLIIFITARTLSADGSDYRDIISPRQMNEMGITRYDVPGLQLSEEERSQLEKIQEHRDAIETLKRSAIQQRTLQTLDAARTNLDPALASPESEEAEGSEWWRRRGAARSR